MPAQPLIVGKPALLIIDIQKPTFIDNSDERAIPNMPDYRAWMEAGRAFSGVMLRT